jgi:hypothetical protein
MSALPKYNIKEIIEILIKHDGIHEGIYALNLEFQVGFGMAGPTTDQSVPSAIIGVSGLSLNKVDIPTPNTVDAAAVNPKPSKSTVSRSPRRKS